MTVTGEPVQPSPPPAPEPGRPARRRDALAVLEVCPYLGAEDRSWRSAYAAREHRCHAVQPPAPLAVAKQRQLCLLAAHPGCATFGAARDVAAAAAPVTPGDDGAALWPAAPTAPVVLEPARRMGALPAASARGGGQALLIGLMVLAFLVLVIARTQSPAGVAGGTPVASMGSGASSAAPASATGEPGGGASGSPVAPSTEPSPTAFPSTAPTPTAPPSAEPSATSAAARTYRVRSGDTLSSIAARFDTTVKILVAVNGLADPRSLRIGQLLEIP
ncbi:MAG TPA: LysM peptidoglycan-binding domain-containing protein [Candidatus Limnocylindrales bacterium]|nr:LysM peptidoglycan-binding domain-containing protein [Candidatus Limnocylindrales bacterium]